MALLQLLLAVLLPLLANASPVATTVPAGNDVCLDEFSFRAVSTDINANAPSTGLDKFSKKDLPIFFFHGITFDHTHGANIEANITAEGRPFVALSFCEKECSIKALSLQVPMAIAAIRDIVARHERFANGYIFVAHSQGGMIARSVIEQMDDHKVHTFVSLAGRRTKNFLKLKEAHFFASPDDASLAPWQTSVFGHYNDVKIFEDIESNFEDMNVLDMHDTVEYKEDTFGLRTLDERGGLFRYTPEKVHHLCWLFDFDLASGDGKCKFRAVYDKYVYKVIS
ncbi:unnamed protein product [Phytophthora fragariaefolia]|uniref:Unnamed protein product n=1 Tax=Phytophthora fragariaefolia TaxID=1490495 RepID=A0A9W7CUZ6_9STRA|nr:unnamed protein product [Phytophthora fragariaefolia]